MLPMIEDSSRPSGCLTVSVYRQSCASKIVFIRRSLSSRPTPQIAQSWASPCDMQRVDAHRHVRPVEPADADVHDARLSVAARS